MQRAIPIARLRAAGVAGPPSFAEADDRPDTSVRRLNLNESAFAPSPKALAAAQAVLAAANVYPDHGCTALAELIAERTGVPRDRLTFGNGSGEILLAAARLAIEPGDAAVFPAPTFQMCRQAALQAGAGLIEVPVRADAACDVEAMLATVTDRTRLFYLCTPNNPTGGLAEAAAVERAAKALPDDCLLVVDEAYHEFGQHDGGADVLSILAGRQGPWVVTRSFSKAYCLAGLRIGYGITSDSDLAAGFAGLRGSFNVNRAGLAAARAAMLDQAHMLRVVHETATQRQRLADGLQALGCAPLPSSTNFLAVRTPRAAAEVRDALAARGILVQALAWPDDLGTLRITIGDAEDTQAVLTAVKQALAGH